MSRKRYTPEQIIGKLRKAEVAKARGQTASQVCCALGIAEQTFYRWRPGVQWFRQMKKARARKQGPGRIESWIS
jgi:hypothetical protein